uniref:Ricin B lectin domain-containing protein n=1 Tax=Mycena chlorophos TaxID=658473 RepID=A0ABQ0LXV2_MYCCL|nr:predicted protein [Mycena chlorophos]
MLSALALLLLAPAVALAQCTPNFQGVAVSIIDSDNQGEWGVSAHVADTFLQSNLESPPLNKTAEWHVEQNGQDPAAYYIKDAGDPSNSLVVTLALESKLLYTSAIAQDNEEQLWIIHCDQCNPSSSEVASGCQIINVDTDLCATTQQGNVNYGAVTCTGAGAQTFNFWAATSA